jgi:opacity protein-like surface antigen
MKSKIFLFTLVGLLFLFSQAYAVSGLGIGIRGGLIRNYSNESVNTLLKDSPSSLKDLNMLGGHLKIGTLPVIDLEISAEYSWKKSEVVIGSFTGELKTEDYSLNASAKYLFSVPVIKPYLGGGAGIHRLVYRLSVTEGVDLVVPDNTNKMGWHLLGGVVLKLSPVPFELFAEGRYTSILTSGKSTHYFTYLAGITMNL